MEFGAALAPHAHAQLASPVSNPAGQFAPPPTIAGRLYQPTLPSRAGLALPLGTWLLYPSFSGGLFYDSNVDQSPGGQQGSFGVHFLPRLFAVHDNGIEKTTAYALADGRMGTNPGSADAQALMANAGLIETYAPLPDLSFRAQADYLRQRDLFSSFAVNQSVGYLNPTGVGLAPTAALQSYNQFTGSLSVTKTFYRAFAGLDASVIDLAYDGSSNAAPAPSGTTATLTTRAGLWISPSLYGYAEGSLDRRDYVQSALGSSGYRAVLGAGTRRIHLVRGEVYTGYQAENYQSAAIGTQSGWVFGGRVDYAPQHRLDLKASLDETLGASLLAPAAPSTPGTATRLTTALAEGDYRFGPDLKASGRAGYIGTRYADSQRRDNAWMIGASVTYSVWRSFGVSFDYQHLDSLSNVPLQSFSRDVVTLSGTYRY